MLKQLERQKIYTDIKEITKENVIKLINDTIDTHRKNVASIKFLKAYEKGKQPILSDTDNNNDGNKQNIVVNNATTVVDFKTGYTMSSPVTYIQRSSSGAEKTDEKKDSVGVTNINEMFASQDKAAKDQKLFREMCVCGISYRSIMPFTDRDEDDLSPFEVINLSPETTYIVYENSVREQKLAAITYSFYYDDMQGLTDRFKEITVYTKNKIYTITGDVIGMLKISEEIDNPLGIIPVVEYSTEDRTGVFEKAIDVLDAINKTTSDRATALARFVDAILWFDNVDVDTNQVKNMKKDKVEVIATASDENKKASIKYVTSELNQSGAQSLADDLYDRMLVITKMPGREQATGGNTGTAVIYGASGWAQAETDAKSMCTTFTSSEKDMLKIALRITRMDPRTRKLVEGLKLSDIDVQISRNRTSNILTKVEGLLQQLNAGIHPRVAIANCDLYNDPEQVYQDSIPWLEKWKYITSDTTQNNIKDDEKLEAKGNNKTVQNID